MSLKILPVLGYENSYLVSSEGQVFSKSRYVKTRNNSRRIVKGRWLKTDAIMNGYRCVTLGRNNARMIHRIVAETFLPKLNDKNQVNHKDGNKLNNNLNNLEWCTQSENTIHAYKLGLIKHKFAKEII